MNNVKVPASDSYRDYLIKSLQDPEEAALYLEAVLEEKDPEPTLLKAALLDVAAAIAGSHVAPEQGQLHDQKLNEILSESGSHTIYGLANWLNELGLKLTVTVADPSAVKESL